MKIFYNNKELFNDEKLSNFDVKKRLRFRMSIEKISLPEIQIFVKTLTGKTITLNTSHLDLI
jgi:hypothetical protein